MSVPVPNGEKAFQARLKNLKQQFELGLKPDAATITDFETEYAALAEQKRAALADGAQRACARNGHRIDDHTAELVASEAIEKGLKMFRDEFAGKTVQFAFDPDKSRSPAPFFTWVATLAYGGRHGGIAKEHVKRLAVEARRFASLSGDDGDDEQVALDPGFDTKPEVLMAFCTAAVAAIRQFSTINSRMLVLVMFTVDNCANYAQAQQFLQHAVDSCLEPRERAHALFNGRQLLTEYFKASPLKGDAINFEILAEQLADVGGEVSETPKTRTLRSWWSRFEAAARAPLDGPKAA